MNLFKFDLKRKLMERREDKKKYNLGKYVNCFLHVYLFYYNFLIRYSRIIIFNVFDKFILETDKKVFGFLLREQFRIIYLQLLQLLTKRTNLYNYL